jgi:hypothetical protein
MMRSRNLIILTLVVLVFGGYILLVERHGPTSDEAAQRASKVFPELDRETIVSFEITASQGDLQFVNEGGEWRLAAPVDYPADEVAVEGLLASMAGLEVERSFEPGEVDPAAHGLEQPKLALVMTDDEGRRFSLEVGHETPLSGKRAIRRGGDDTIILSSGAFVDDLDREIDQWRSRDVIDVFEVDVASIEITAGEDHIHAVRTRDRWQLLEPLADLADSEQMRSLVSELNSLRVSEFLPADGDPAEFGLDSPTFTIVIIRTDVSEPVTLELGAEAENDGAATVVCRRNGRDLFRIPASIMTRLAKAPVLWRSDKVWPFSSWDVKRLTITGADSVVVEDEDGVWRLEDGGEADGSVVRSRLNALADLEARDFDLMLPPSEVIGHVVLTLEDDGPKELSYTFYAPLEDGGHSAVTLSARDNVMGVDAAVVESIIGELDRLQPDPESVPMIEEDQSPTH